MSKIIWYFKQLLPLTYVTDFHENGVHKLVVWRMWFGRCFDIREWEIR